MGINLQKASTLLNAQKVSSNSKSIQTLKDIHVRSKEELIANVEKQCDKSLGDKFEALRKAAQEKKPLKFELPLIHEVKKPNIFKRILAKIFG